MITTRRTAAAQLPALLPHAWRRLWAVSLTLTQQRWNHYLLTGDIGGILRHDINNVCWSCHLWLAWKFQSVLSCSWFTGGVSYGYTNKDGGGGKCAHNMASRSSATLLSTTQTAAFAGNGKWEMFTVLLAWVAMVSDIMVMRMVHCDMVWKSR